MSWIIDWLPWWFIYAVIGVVALVTINIWLPAATAIWRVLPTPVRWILTGGLAALMAWLAGRSRGRANELERQKRRDARAMETRLETNREIGRLSDPEFEKERRRWERD